MAFSIHEHSPHGVMANWMIAFGTEGGGCGWTVCSVLTFSVDCVFSGGDLSVLSCWLIMFETGGVGCADSVCSGLTFSVDCAFSGGDLSGLIN